MPKHSFGLLDVNVKKLNAKKNPKRLLHDFTGNGDDLLTVFHDFLANVIGAGKACKKQKYISVVDIEMKGRVLWFQVQVGRWGLPGHVVDTSSHSPAYQIRAQDAPVYDIRGALIVPAVGEDGLLAAEVVGSHSFLGTLWPEFQEWFHPKYSTPERLSPRASTSVESPAWSKYLEEASLRSVTFTSYERSSNKARRVQARDWVVRSMRNEVLPKDWIGKLAKERLSPRAVVTDIPTGFEPEETKIEMDGPGGHKTIVIEKDYPRFLYQLGDEDDPTPTDVEFREAVLSEASDTLTAMGLNPAQILAGAI
jgi:hypothetical protein